MSFLSLMNFNHKEEKTPTVSNSYTFFLLINNVCARLSKAKMSSLGMTAKLYNPSFGKKVIRLFKADQAENCLRERICFSGVKKLSKM